MELTVTVIGLPTATIGNRASPLAATMWLFVIDKV